MAFGPGPKQFLFILTTSLTFPNVGSETSSCFGHSPLVRPLGWDYSRQHGGISQPLLRGAQWLSDRATDPRARDRRFETYLRRVASLSKTIYSLKVLEKLFTGTLSLNTSKQPLLVVFPTSLTFLCRVRFLRTCVVWL